MREAQAGIQVAKEPDHHRTRPRIAVDQDAVLLLVSHGLPVQCRIVDLSLEGCRVSNIARFPTGPGVHVEVTFKVNGIAFRFGGSVQCGLGIHFVGVNQPRREELAEVLDEVEGDAAVRAAKEAAEKLAAELKAAAALACAEQSANVAESSDDKSEGS
jgi:hypothetical protein